MKKIFLTTSLFAALTVMFTSCLKDKGFEKGTYGINDPDTQPPGVGFPLGNKNQAFGLNVSASNQAVNGFVYVNIESGKAAASDVHVTLTNITTAAVAAYNTANGLTGVNQVLELPTSLYNVALALTVPAGGHNVQVPINVTNTTSLDPARTYAVSFNIASVDGGYVIASNLQKLFIIFNIKNRLDGHYEITGVALRAGDAALSGSVGTYERDLSTAGANTVQWEGTVFWGAQASQLPAGYEPRITVDPTTNLVTQVTSPVAGNGVMMTAPVVRTDIIGPTQRYDPVAKIIHFEFTYGAGPASRLFSLNAKYLHPR